MQVLREDARIGHSQSFVSFRGYKMFVERPFGLYEVAFVTHNPSYRSLFVPFQISIARTD